MSVTPYLFLARRAEKTGHPVEAAALSCRHLEQRPNDVQALRCLGVSLARQGETAQAVTILEKAVLLAPNWAELRCDFAGPLLWVGRGQEAEQQLRDAVRLSPKLFEARRGLGILLRQTGRDEEALEQFVAAEAIRPQARDVHLASLSCLIRLERFDGVEAALRSLLNEQPNDVETLYQLGDLLYRQDRLAEAEEPLCQALTHQPNHAEALGLLGMLLKETARPVEAEQVLRMGLIHKPGDPEIEMTLAVLLLSLGRFDEGWPLFEARLHPARRQKILKDGLPPFPCPPWRGEPIAGKAVLVWVEQGYGDVIQFCRYVTELKRMGAARVSFCCYGPLTSLMRSLPGVDAVYPLDGTLVRMPVHDYWAVLLSLPGLTKSLPQTIPYLSATPRQDLPPGPKVGVLWHGGQKFIRNRLRSLPGLHSLAPLWRVPGITFVSLQKGVAEDEAEHPPAGQPLLPLGAQVADFQQMADLIAGLDLVITVDTAVAHLAGALGKPCWLMLGKRCDWRWGTDDQTEDTTWYPGWIRFYRQQTEGEWQSVIQKVADDLAAERFGQP